MEKKFTKADEKIVKALTKKLILIRGEVINIFITLEYAVEQIIRKITFEGEENFDEFVGIFFKTDLSNEVKSKLLRICLAKYQKKFGKDLTGILDAYLTLLDKRNQLAHWRAHTGRTGIDLYKTKKQIMLFKERSDKKPEIVYLKDTTVKDFTNMVYKAFTLVDILNTLNKKSPTHLEFDRTIKKAKPRKKKRQG